MAVVNLSINGRQYDIACDDSQVAQINQLGREVDDRAQLLVKQLGNIPDARLLVMVGLMLADELTESRAQLKAAGGDAAALAEGDARMARGIEALAQQVEAIAERLENS